MGGEIMTVANFDTEYTESPKLALIRQYVEARQHVHLTDEVTRAWDAVSLAERHRSGLQTKFQKTVWGCSVCSEKFLTRRV
jgi:hypothetical protein